MNRYKNKFDKKIRFIFLALMCFSLFYFQTMVFSALNSTMGIAGDAYVRVDEDIRVSGINLVGVENSALELYSPSYSKNTIKTGIRLDSLDGIVNYKFVVSNLGDLDMEITEIISNVDNNLIADNSKRYKDKLTEIIDFLLRFLYVSPGSFYEVNQVKPLFHEKQKWTVDEAVGFLHVVKKVL